MKLDNVILSWQHDQNLELIERPFRDFTGRVVPGGESITERYELFGQPGINFEHISSFADFLTLTVECTDLFALSSRRFYFQQATGLRHEGIS